MPKLKPPEEMERGSGEEEPLEPIPSHPTWSGSISMGLVNIPVRAIPITIERKISFRMLHQKCSIPIFYRLFCEEGDKIPKLEPYFRSPENQLCDLKFVPQRIEYYHQMSMDLWER